ncbi:uncharacterized protein TNCV_4626771 [Trichonephila clavipes]|nr:uncharacterized protein TNCV_4626771 [Trichonephila clavipes]
MDNPNMPIKVWNVYGQRHRTNNSVEGWNSKLNAITGRNQPNVHLLVKILKEETQKEYFNVKARELGDSGIKRKKAHYLFLYLSAPFICSKKGEGGMCPQIPRNAVSANTTSETTTQLYPQLLSLVMPAINHWSGCLTDCIMKRSSQFLSLDLFGRGYLRNLFHVCSQKKKEKPVPRHLSNQL